jgi:hypothetical protein
MRRPRRRASRPRIRPGTARLLTEALEGGQRARTTVTGRSAQSRPSWCGGSSTAACWSTRAGTRTGRCTKVRSRRSADFEDLADMVATAPPARTRAGCPPVFGSAEPTSTTWSCSDGAAPRSQSRSAAVPAEHPEVDWKLFTPGGVPNKAVEEAESARHTRPMRHSTAPGRWDRPWYQVYTDQFEAAFLPHARTWNPWTMSTPSWT